MSRSAEDVAAAYFRMVGRLEPVLPPKQGGGVMVGDLMPAFDGLEVDAHAVLRSLAVIVEGVTFVDGAEALAIRIAALAAFLFGCEVADAG